MGWLCIFLFPTKPDAPLTLMDSGPVNRLISRIQTDLTYTMKIEEILFLGGPFPKFGSVGIRCLDIAKRLGCAFQLNIRTFDDIKEPHKYKAFVCVRTRLTPDDLAKLSKTGFIIWDIIDSAPPEKDIQLYLASTNIVNRLYCHLGDIVTIPHHHCNFEGQLSAHGCDKLGWIGNLHWYPSLNGLPHGKYDVKGLSRYEIAELYRKIGLGLNIRTVCLDTDWHIKINSGIKLINCIGFGIPSISAIEPPYLEIGEGCTLFTSGSDLHSLVLELQSNHLLYEKLRNECIRRAKSYDITIIVQKYASLFGSL
jgi:hypothetical protein